MLNQFETQQTSPVMQAYLAISVYAKKNTRMVELFFIYYLVNVCLLLLQTL